MKFLSRLSLKNFSVFAVFLGIFIVAFPAVSVFAASQSPSDLNIFSITSGEQNKQLNRNCGYSTAEGLLAGSLSALEQIAAVRFEDYAEKVYCEEGDITGLFNSDKSTGVLGVLNKVNNTILAQRPASGVQFIEDKVYAITNPGVVHADEPASYFPGTGFDLLQPIRGFWGWAVNLVFGVLVILIIFVAFAIIFRVKLPGNVTVTLQNSIPNIALAMILVPLSYAISGLFIDAITIGTNAIHDFLLGPASPGYSVYASRDTNGNDRGLYVDDDRVTWINARSLVDVSQEVEGVALQTGLDAGPLQVVGSFLNIFDEDTINANSANPGGTSAWLGTIINALLSIFMIWIGIKIFIRLFKKYITLMITPIFAPFVFATVAVPGNGTKAIMNFVKLMGSASLGFIVTYGMILLTVIFSSEAFQATIPNMNTGLWNPPLLGLGSFINPAQTIGGVVSNSSVVPFIMALISIGIYFSIPGVLDQIDQALGGNMSLPKFLSVPFESFRESVNQTRKYTNLGTYKGYVAKTEDKLLGGNRGSQRLQRNLGQRKYDLEKRMQDALRTRNDPNASIVEKARAEATYQMLRPQLAGLNGQIAATGVTPSFYGEKDAKPNFAVTPDFAGQPIGTITRDQLGKYGLMRIGDTMYAHPVKLKFSAQGFQFTKEVAKIISIHTSVKVKGGAGFQAGPMIGTIGIKAGQVLFELKGKASGGVLIRAIVDPGKFDAYTNSSSPDKWELPLSLILQNPAAIGTSIDSVNAARSEDLIFKYMDYESDPVKLLISYREV